MFYVGRVQATLGPPGTASPSAIPGLATGDLLLVLVSDRDVAAQDVPGYTNLADVTLSPSLRSSVWAKRVTGDPASEPDISITWGGTGARIGEVQAWRGGDSTTILDVAVSTASTWTLPLNTAGVSTVTAGAMVLHFVAVVGSSGTISGSSPFDVAAASQLTASANTLRQVVFAHTQVTPGATGTATATDSYLYGYATGFLIALRPMPPTPADMTAAATFGATHDGSYDPTLRGIVTGVVTAGATHDAIQAEVGSRSDSATFGSSQDAAANFSGGELAAVTLGGVVDASYVPAGVVLYPDSETWQLTLIGISSTPTLVTLHSDRGEVAAFWITDEGIVPQISDVITAGATQDASQADRGGLTAPVTLGAQHSGEWNPQRAPGWFARIIRSGWSWVGGPYRRIPQDQVGDAAYLVTAGALHDGNWTPKDAVAGTADAVILGSVLDAIFHIVEPEVRISVPPIPYGSAVKPNALGCRVPAIPWSVSSVTANVYGSSVPPNPMNALVPARRRK